jgi:transcriptional regulator with XRE-family HTH domain
VDNAQLAGTIKELCKNRGTSISKMLSACDIRKSLIYDLEKRDFTPSITVAERIADYLDCSIDYLLGRTDNPDVNVNENDNCISVDNNVQTVRSSGDVTIRQITTGCGGSVLCEIEAMLDILPRSEQHRAIADMMDLLEEKYSE